VLLVLISVVNLAFMRGDRSVLLCIVCLVSGLVIRCVVSVVNLAFVRGDRSVLLFVV